MLRAIPISTSASISSPMVCCRTRFPGRAAAMFASMALALFHNAKAHPSLAPGWSSHKFFNPEEETVTPPASLRRLNPPTLSPATKGSFARHTLLKRLPDTATRVLRENEGNLTQREKDSLRALADEVPDIPMRPPVPVNLRAGMGEAAVDAGSIAYFNKEWEAWTSQRSGNWTLALPLISTEIYFYRRILDATMYFVSDHQRFLVDPFEPQKQSSLTSALASEAFVEAANTHIAALEKFQELEPRAVKALFIRLLHYALWSNQGDLALAPSDSSNVNIASQICTSSSSSLLVDDSAAAFDLLQQRASRPGARVDLVTDNSGIELLCDLVFADFLLTHRLAAAVRLHVKGEPLFVSDAMPQDVASHLRALQQHPSPALNRLALRLLASIQAHSLQVHSHMFWTAPRLFWEMPLSLASELSQAALVVIKGDANYRRLVGDRQWEWTTPLQQVLEGWFPAPALVLRTFKAEIAVGLQEGQGAAAAAQDPNWLTNGRFGSVQFVPGGAPPRAGPDSAAAAGAAA